MDLQKLRGFFWTAQLGSLSAAARKIHVSQSAVSHQLKSLENELGAKLYERTGRGVMLTAEGMRLLDYARGVVQSIDDLEEEFATMRGQARGTVRLAAFRGIAAYSLPNIVQRFQERHPGVRLVISSKIFDRDILRLTAAGEVDLGVTASWNAFGELEYLEYAAYEMYACTALDHRWAGRSEPLSLAELAAEPLLLYEQGTAIRSRINHVFAREGLEPEVPVEAGGSHALTEYVKIGLGVGIFSGLVVGRERDVAVHTIPVTDLFGKLGYGFVLRPGRYLPAATRAFLEVAGVTPGKAAS